MRWFEKANAIRKTIRPKLTYERIGLIMGRSTSTIGAWFKGRNNPTIEEIQELAGVLGVSLQELTSGDDFWIRDDNERAWIVYYRSLPELERSVLIKTLGVAPALALPPPEVDDEDD